MAKQNKIINPTKEELIEYEKEMLGINITSIMSDAKLKIQYNSYNSIKELELLIENSNVVNNFIIPGYVRFIEQKISGNGNPFYWIGIADDRSFIKLFCNSNVFNEFSSQIIKGKISLFNINVKNGFVSFNKCILMSNVPFKKDCIFVIHLPFNIYSTSIIEYIEDNIDVTIKRGNVPVYQNTRETDLKINPTIDLIEKIYEIFKVKCSIENLEDYIWGESNRLIKEMEENGY